MSDFPKYAISIQKYVAESEDYLGFKKGVKIIVLSEDERGWLVGKINEQEGYFPKTAIKYLKEKLPKQKDNSPKNKRKNSGGFGNQKQQQQQQQPLERTLSKKEIRKQKKMENQRLKEQAKLKKIQEKNRKKNISNFIEDFRHIEDNWIWQVTEKPFTVSVSTPTKQGKYKGMKKYMSYEVKHDNNLVQRRFKHFLWLNQRMNEKYPNIPIPVMPGKQAQGRFEENFVAKRREGLIRFLNRLGEHPVMRSSKILHHFLEAGTQKDWKLGKHAAIKKKNLQTFHRCVTCSPTLTEEDVQDISEYKKSLAFLENTLKTFDTIRSDLPETRYPTIIENFNQFGKMLKLLSINEDLGLGWRYACYPSKMLEKAYTNLGEGYLEIAKIWDQKKLLEDSTIFEDFYEYYQHINLITDTLKIRDKSYSNWNTLYTQQQQQQQQQKGNEKKNKQALKKIQQLKDTSQEMDKITMAELEWYHWCRLRDFKKTLNQFVDAQIDFADQIADKLESCLKYVEKIPVIHGSEKPQKQK
ncbi:sorting nexin [Anaeramoeba flamelloides]|uniref:Sorting nexin n=1 Tax=Anaeramoeba flamelloides TaxID=1746091 RepID=A0ABQ8XLW2_9EUKA|nr:sorting nexin [Anaeramoeba flamelloides]